VALKFEKGDPLEGRKNEIGLKLGDLRREGKFFKEGRERTGLHPHPMRIYRPAGREETGKQPSGT